MNKMRKTVMVVALTATIISSIPISGFAQGVTPPPTQWWQVAAGILSIPAALVGIAYSYALVHKTRLEIRKTELEIIEKEQALRKLKTEDKEAIETAVKPVIANQQIQYLIPRFIILFLVLQFWGLVELGLQYLSGGIYYATSQLLNLDPNNIWLQMPFAIIAFLPKAAYWVILFAVGWPLFKDANSNVGLNLKDLFALRSTKKSPQR